MSCSWMGMVMSSRRGSVETVPLKAPAATRSHCGKPAPNRVHQEPVAPLALLFPAQPPAVARLLAPPLAVLAGGEVTALDGAFFRVAPRPLQEQLQPLAAAEPADGTTCPRHSFSPPLRPAGASAGGSRCAGSA